MYRMTFFSWSLLLVVSCCQPVVKEETSTKVVSRDQPAIKDEAPPKKDFFKFLIVEQSKGEQHVFWVRRIPPTWWHAKVTEDKTVHDVMYQKFLGDKTKSIPELRKLETRIQAVVDKHQGDLPGFLTELKKPDWSQ